MQAITGMGAAGIPAIRKCFTEIYFPHIQRV